MPPNPSNPFAGLSAAVADPRLVQKIAQTRKEQIRTEEKITQEQVKQTRALQQIQGSMQRLRGLASAVAALGAAGSVFGGFTREIASMSVEGERLGRAFELLKKVVGDALAPYFRAATAAVVELARAYYGLDPAVKETVAAIFAGGTALSALASGFFLASHVVGPLIGAVTTLAGGMGALVGVLGGAVTALAAVAGWPAVIVGGLVALAAAVTGGASAFAFFADESKSMQEKVTSVVEMVLNTWTYFKAATIATWTYATEVIRAWADAVYQFVKPVIDWIGSAIQFLWDQLRALGGALGEFGLAAARGLDPAAFEKAAAAWQKAIAGLGQNKGIAQNLVGGVFNALNRAQNAFQNKAPMRWRVNVEFETLQGTWDRLQKAFVSAEGENLQKAMLDKMGAAADGIQKVANNGVNVLNFPPVVN